MITRNFLHKAEVLASFVNRFTLFAQFLAITCVTQAWELS